MTRLRVLFSKASSAMALMILACGLASCANSVASNSQAPGLRLSPLPGQVYAEAEAVTPLPEAAKGCTVDGKPISQATPAALAEGKKIDVRCSLTGKQAEQLILDLRRSELRKVRALKAGIEVHNKQRGYLKQRARPDKKEQGLFGGLLG